MSKHRSARPVPLPEVPAPRAPFSGFVAIVVGIVLFACTLLLCEVPGLPSFPLGVDRLLTAPIALTQLTDLREYAVPVGLALCLGLITLLRGDTFRGPMSGLSAWWFEALALTTLVLACASAWKNGSWESSRGWIFWTTCGMGWAIVLSRIETWAHVRWSIFAAGIVAAAGAVLSIIHRQELGEAYFQLPVGPITLTASLGALWSSIAIVWLFGAILQRRANRKIVEQAGHAGRSNSPSLLAIVLAVVVLVCSLALLFFAGRRGAWLGLVVGVGAAGGLVLWMQYSGKMNRVALSAAVLVGLTAAGWYVRDQARSPEAAVSVPLKIRATYWKLMLDSLSRNPLWGVGPDQFMPTAMTALARQRAEQPKVLHGNLDAEGHNEWLQAAFELGLPGGLFYLALPIGVIFAGARRWSRTKGAERTVVLALIAGVVVVCVSEASSVNLRHPILQGWYWTLLGLTLAVSRGAMDARVTPRSAPASKAVRIAAAVVAVAILAVVANDFRTAVLHAGGRALMNQDAATAAERLERATRRSGTSRWLSTRFDLGTVQANLLRSSRVPPALRRPEDTTGETEMTRYWGEKAVATWRELVRASPGYLDSGFRLAEAQNSTGDTQAAVATLDVYLRDVNPYDTQANVLLTNIAGRGPVENLEAVCRGLRSGAMSRWLVGPATRSLGTQEGIGQWPTRVELAKEDVTKPSEKDWKDPLAPEVLRVEALRFASLKRFAEAAELQRLAAEAYQRLDDSNSPVARPLPAVADAWYGAARLLFDADPQQYAEAFKRIVEAEESVRVGIAGDIDDKGKPSELGAAVVASRTEELSQLLLFSAKLHLIATGDARSAQVRIGWSLSQPTQEAVDAVLGRIAVELIQTYRETPEERRPPEFLRVARIAQRFLAVQPQESK
ncbi:MAG TPA: O-antigen ligase family protein [Phycisphaerae bacterium]|nr:O-antigen ligase family protein [Phycisphaerae bacterium]